MDEIENQVENTEIENPEIESNPDAAPIEPEYQPNYKFKVGESEFEFDERVRGNIQKKEDEEYFRDLYTKAYGLDVVKKRSEEKEERYKQTESEYSGLRSTHERVQNTLQKLNTLKSDDFGTFQKAWEIPDQAILRRASEILKTHDDPDARAQVEQLYSNRLQMLQYEDRVNTETQNQHAVQRQLHEMKMHSALQDPDVSRFAAEYDRRMGTPGAFVEEVNRLGTIEFHSGRYEDPKVIVAKTHQRLSKLMAPLGTHASVTPPTASQQPAPRPSLPNLGSGRTGTAVSKKPRSIADLRKLAQSFQE